MKKLIDVPDKEFEVKAVVQLCLFEKPEGMSDDLWKEMRQCWEDSKQSIDRSERKESDFSEEYNFIGGIICTQKMNEHEIWSILILSACAVALIVFGVLR